MSRPPKPRMICEFPDYSVFGPKGAKMNKLKQVAMNIDEWETIKLIDYMGFTQEQAADHMKVARTTVQRIYNLARQKVAEMFVEGTAIVIEGGEVVLCDENCDECLEYAKGRGRGRRMRRQRFKNKEE